MLIAVRRLAIQLFFFRLQPSVVLNQRLSGRGCEARASVLLGRKPPWPSPQPCLSSTSPASTHRTRTVPLSSLNSAPPHEVGFFRVTGHGVPAALREEVLSAARRFFALPEKQRLEIENIKSPQFRGYTRTGTEYTAGGADWREQIDIGPERPALETGPGDPDYLRLIGPNQWPSALPS
ncbi:2-oxoglutarate and iron-dependent oxygenase domain-containing protein [Streptomyces sp. NPDC001307]|uniref:2-oxoglutarate and iron-dependent oxygenase domain-containing protein n=1 Tax=Streptomyces sp. NPDC001307 TaxID=3364560 RepID=UPI0036B2DC8E